MHRGTSRFWLAGLLGVLSVVSSLSAPMEPTPLEQYTLELINRARSNPDAEAQRNGIDLNRSLPPGYISSEPKQPLAFHPCLIGAARPHSEWLLERGILDHWGEDGSFFLDRIFGSGYYLDNQDVAENLGWWGSYDEPTDWQGFVEGIHGALFRDAIHRPITMATNLCEIGVGIASGILRLDLVFVDIVQPGMIMTQDFVEERRFPSGQASTHFLTGVTFDDQLVSDDDFYTPGEGLGGIHITAIRGSDQMRFDTNTWNSGGYSLPLPPGTYTITATGLGLGTITRRGVVMGDQNLKLDFRPTDPSDPPPPTPPVVEIMARVQQSPAGAQRQSGSGANLVVQISLQSGCLEGQNADWWICGETPYGWISWDTRQNAWVGGRRVSYQRPLTDMPSEVVLQTSHLNPGKYTFYFGVDTVVNGKVDRGSLYFDGVAFTVPKSGGAKVATAKAPAWASGW